MLLSELRQRGRESLACQGSQPQASESRCQSRWAILSLSKVRPAFRSISVWPHVDLLLSVSWSCSRGGGSAPAPPSQGKVPGLPLQDGTVLGEAGPPEYGARGQREEDRESGARHGQGFLRRVCLGTTSAETPERGQLSCSSSGVAQQAPRTQRCLLCVGGVCACVVVLIAETALINPPLIDEQVCSTRCLRVFTVHPSTNAE